MKKSLCLVFLLFGLALQAQVQLSHRGRISVLTSGPYQAELYSAFGHSAVRVYDPVQNIDWVYNYGIFDFDQPYFYLNFARGNLRYLLAVGDYPRFRLSNLREKRYLHEQILQLDAQQAQAYFDFLQHNALPENREYQYDYFYDNCATRIRDGLQAVLDADLLWDTTDLARGASIRALCDDYLQQQPWGDLGIDLCLGLPMDRRASTWQYMFLPDYLESTLAQAKIRQGDSLVALVAENSLQANAGPQAQASRWWRPLFVSYGFFALSVILTIFNYHRPRRLRLFDTLIFGATGLIGFLLLALWFFTEHQAAAKNLNLLWALPFHLGLVFSLWRPQLSKLWRKYLSYLPYYTASLLAFWWWLPQNIHLAWLPWAAMLAFRAWHMARKY